MIKAAYLHIPFCEHICHYCDFNKVFLKNQPVDEYLQQMEMEMAKTVERFPTKQLDTIFVGGGTPTSLTAKQLEKFLTSIHEYLPFQKDKVEFTFEANPGDLSSDKLQVLKDFDVNRLSFGVQSFNDELLKRIGRSHRKADVFQSIKHARKVGFDNISIDLIYSLPDQTVQDFQETLKTAIDLGMEHYSAYSLIIEPKTVFYNLMNKGKLPLPSQEDEARMYEVLMEEMENNHYYQYEISNFAKNGFACKHNITYWENEQYYGFGAGAHSYLNSVRRSNIGPLNHYMQAISEGRLPFKDEHTVPKHEQMEEELFLGLRKKEGVSTKRFKEKFQLDMETVFGTEIIEHINNGLLEWQGDRLMLTKKGKFLGNEVFQSFIGVSEG